MACGRLYRTTSGIEMFQFIETIHNGTCLDHEASRDQWKLHGIAFSPDDHEIVSGWPSNIARIWDVVMGKPLRRHLTGAADLHGTYVQEGCYTRLAVSSDGRFVLTGSTTIVSTDPIVPQITDGVAKLWDLRQGQLIRRFDGHDGNVSAVAFSPNGKLCNERGELLCNALGCSGRTSCPEPCRTK